MARSLTVTQEESPRASVLFMTFIALCAGLLILTWFTGNNVDPAGDVVGPAAAQTLP